MDEDGYLYLIGSGPPVSRASKKERRCRGGRVVGAAADERGFK